VNGKSLTFRAKGLDVGGAGSVELVPFFRLHDSRYTLYWPRAAGAGSEASVR
jgi:hypothetical protein